MYVARIFAQSPRALFAERKGFRTSRLDEVFIIGEREFPFRWMAEAWAKNAMRSLLANRCFYEVTEEPVTATEG